MPDSTFRVALLSEVFLGDGAADRLVARLTEARGRGAELAVLPEIPLNPGRPRPPFPGRGCRAAGGAAARALSQAARQRGSRSWAGPSSARSRRGRPGSAQRGAPVRRLRGARGVLREAPTCPTRTGSASPPLRAGSAPPSVLHLAGVPVGIQICSDSNRPEGSHLLGAQGPRSSSRRAPPRPRPGALEARPPRQRHDQRHLHRLGQPPAPEFGVALGGPSVAIAPDGEVLLETTAPLAVVELDRGAIAAARKRYPRLHGGPRRPYGQAWNAIAAAKPSH